MNRLRTLMLVGVALAACGKKDEYTLPRTRSGGAEAKSPAVTTTTGGPECEQFLSRTQQEVAGLNTRIKASRKQAWLATGKLQPKLLALDREMKKCNQN